MKGEGRGGIEEGKEIAVIPLQNSILFPKTQVPMLVKDQTYIRVVKESVANQEIVGLFTKMKGKLFDVGCAGKIVSMTEAGNNIWNVIFEGLFRIKIVKKLDENPIKIKFEILNDILPPQDEQEKLKKEILKTALEYLTVTGRSKDEIKRIASFIIYMPLEQVVNWGGMLHPMPLDKKLELLQTDDVGARADMLIRIIRDDIQKYKMLIPFRNMIPKDPKVN